MVFDRPKHPGKKQPIPATNRPNRPPSPATQRSTSGQSAAPKKVISTGGGGNPPGRNQGGNSNENNQNPQPSPWLEHPSDPNPNPSSTASFVEYLRWMRSSDSQYKDPTKVQILQMAEEQANYRDRLTTLTNRTKLIAGEGNTFVVKCLWRIRVGGHRGPESILLPAFDALGMPYIPASTLRGVTRTQAIRALMLEENRSWKRAEEIVSRKYFGYLDSKNSQERSGKIIFLDAYPIPQQSGNGGGLTVDMANNIWSWDTAGRDLLYSPNPNPFFSLEEATFLIGFRRASQCKPEEFEAISGEIKTWLTQGLQSGIGSQVNTGYGSLVRAGQTADPGFFSVNFTLEGQLIHGRQKFTQWQWNDRRNEWQMRGTPEAEVRPVAFKSMLRYWFRAFALGVLPVGTERALTTYLKAICEGQSISPPPEVKALEALLFGSITPQTRGWVTFQIHNGKIVQQEARSSGQGKDDPCGEQSGELKLFLSSEAPSQQQKAIQKLMRSLVWLMFHLGGLGQGARRPCYSRKTRERAPWWRGSSLIPDSEDDFWNLPDDVQAFQQLFRQRLQAFYDALGQLSNQNINLNLPRSAGEISKKDWVEAVDSNCRIVVCSGATRYSKPYALAVLHSDELKFNDNYDAALCGTVLGAKVKPSPVWIADLGDYQVVTIFGITNDSQNPRQRFLKALKSQTESKNYAQIWSLT